MKYQQTNPNNCRVNVDFNRPDNPVQFEYVGTSSAFKICYNFWYAKTFYVFGITGIFLAGLIYGYIFSDQLLMAYLTLVFVISLLFIFPFFTALIFSQTKLIKLMPYLWASGKTVYYAEFKPDDLIDNKLEIPLYNNVFLAYEMFGDFKNQKDKIEVLEHPFNMIKRRKNNKKIKRNEYLWKATFYFKDIPKDGLLKVQFH